MADLNIKCPGCGQEMVCDDAYAGQEVQCPSCQKNVMVPKPATASQAADNPLVPKVPQGAAPKLSIGTKETHGKGAAAQASHPMNLRKPGAGPAKKKFPIKDVAIYTVLVLILVGGGVYGFQVWQKSKAEKEAAAAAAQKPAPKPEAASPEATAAAAEAPVDPAASAEAPPAAETPKKAKAAKTLPVIPPSYTLDSAFAKIPESKVNGSISGGDFLPETVRLEQTPSSQVLRFVQGAPAAVERELVVYLKLKLADLTNGHSVTITSDQRGSGLPQVVKRWRTNPKYAPSSKTFGYGYVMKLELQKVKGGEIPGKLYVALPDKEESVVAGVFKLPLPSQDPNQPAAAAMPQMASPAAGMAPAEQEAFRRRYGGAR